MLMLFFSGGGGGGLGRSFEGTNWKTLHSIFYVGRGNHSTFTHVHKLENQTLFRKSGFCNIQSADQRDKDQRATHQPDTVKCSNNLINSNKKNL